MEENDNSAAWAMVSQNAATTAINAAETKAGRRWQEEQMQIDRDWQEQMYQRQLDDSIDWNREQREYNSIGAQMQRYRDAGINPMYAVTGKGMDQVVQPFSASSGGFKTSTPSPYQGKTYQMDFATAISLQNQTRVAKAQQNMLNAQAKDYQASAAMKDAQVPGLNLERDIINALRDWRTEDGKDVAWLIGMTRWDYVVDKMQQYQDLEFEDAKRSFFHSEEVRKFERALNDQERAKFQESLKQCQSTTEILRVAAEWAVANQWINAGTGIVNSAVGLVGAFKPRVAPVTNVNKTTHVYDPTQNINFLK